MTTVMNRSQQTPAHGTGTPTRTAPGRLPTARRSWGTVTAGVLVVVVGGLVGALVFAQAGQTASVLAVGDTVAKGQTIDRADLVSKQVAGVDGAVAVESIDSVVGKTAAVDLTAGQVVTTSMVTADPIPHAGQAVVGLELSPAQMPGAHLAAGDMVRVVRVPDADQTGDAAEKEATLASSARVLEVGGQTSAGEAARVVTVLASRAEADQLAQASAAGQAALIKMPASEQDDPAETGEGGD